MAVVAIEVDLLVVQVYKGVAYLLIGVDVRSLQLIVHIHPRVFHFDDGEGRFLLLLLRRPSIVADVQVSFVHLSPQLFEILEVLKPYVGKMVPIGKAIAHCIIHVVHYDILLSLEEVP